MRDVLFRGKKTIDGDCAFGNLETSPIGVAHIIEDYFFYAVQAETVSEFSGRFDTKENRIFENDIVEEAGGHRSVVKYSEEEAKFVLESKYVVTELGNKQVTVIGNIFDNPDLIDNA